MLIEEYGLKTIPFKSQGSESGKYPFVPSNSFNELISEIEKIHEQKDSSAIIVQGPQGSGKTATRNGIVNSFSQKPNIAIIAVNLSSIDLRDLAWSIIDKTKEENIIDDEFLEQIGYLQGQDIEKPKLEKIIIRVIEELVSKNEFGILIIDEFDIISQPTFHDTNDQTIFLHNITNILNLISESKIIQEKSFCTILEQTDKSSEDFRNYVSNRHRPLSSRLKRNIDIKYNFDETKQIIKKRLDAEQIPEFEIPARNELFPLDEEILKFLYDHINQLTQTNSMIAFRDMEQILHDSMEKSLENNLPKVELDAVKEIFTLTSSKFGNTQENVRKISIETKNELKSVMKNEDQNIANCLYLNGIKTAMETWEKREYAMVESDLASSRYKNEENGIFISSIKIKLKTPDSVAYEKNIVWYAASKSSNEPFTDEDFNQINSFLEENQDDQIGSQRTILTIFTEIPGISEQELQSEIIPTIDKIFYRGNSFKQAIVGIYLSKSDEEIEQFRPEWDGQLHTFCATYLGATLFDLGAKIDIKHVSLIQFLYTKSILGQKFKKDEWLSWGKRLSRKIIQEKVFKQIKTLGFTDDEYNAFVPKNLKSLKTLIDSKEIDAIITDNEINEYFGNNYTLNASKLFGIVNEKNRLNNADSIKEKISDELIEKIKDVLPENSDSLSYNLQILKLINDAFERIDDDNDYFKKIIVLQFILEQGRKSLNDLGSDDQPTSQKNSEDTETTDTETTDTETTDTETTDTETTDTETTDTETTDTETTDTKIEITNEKIIKACKEVLKEKKLSLSDLKKEISKKPGFIDQSKWVGTLLTLVRNGTILLTVDD